MDKKKVLGFLTDIGGRTSHTAIMSRTLEIAAVVGLNSATTEIKDGDFIAFNGNTGEVIINPDEETITTYRKLKADYEEYKKALELFEPAFARFVERNHGVMESVRNADGTYQLDWVNQFLKERVESFIREENEKLLENKTAVIFDLDGFYDILK